MNELATQSLILGNGNILTASGNTLYLNGQTIAGNFLPLTGGIVSGSLDVTQTLTVGSGAGIYTFSKVIAPSSNTNIFSIFNLYGTQTFNLGINCAQSGFCVGKLYSIIAPYSGIPIVNLNNNSGPFNGNDFNITISNTGVSGILLNINNVGTITGTFTATLFLYGTSQIVNINQF